MKITKQKAIIYLKTKLLEEKRRTRKGNYWNETFIEALTMAIKSLEGEISKAQYINTPQLRKTVADGTQGMKRG